MNDVVATQRQAFSLAPQNLTEAMEFARMMSDSELVPKAFKGKPGDVLIAVQMGAEVGLQPMAAIQSIAVINGKPGIYGDAGKAILLNAGCVIEEDDIEIIKQTGRGRCKITRGGRPPVERTFSIENAQKAGLWNKDGPWKNYPERQMAWRAFWFAARDAAADLLRGFGGAEELVDFEALRDVTPRQAEPKAPPALPNYADDKFKLNLPAWRDLIAKGTKTADEIIATVSTKHTLTEAQKAEIKKPATAGAPAVTYAQVADKLNKAEDMDLLDVAADLIGEVPDAGQREELQALYRQRQAQIGGAA